jgi:hypothetical protein
MPSLWLAAEPPVIVDDMNRLCVRPLAVASELSISHFDDGVA